MSHSEDRISDLPEQIITEILNLLPTKVAVATSILSKSWRLRWKQVTTFDSEVNDIRTLSENRRFWESSGNVLLKLKIESLRKYRLRWNNIHYPGASWIIDRVSPLKMHGRRVKALKVLDLDLDQTSVDTTLKLPDEIYSCKTLEVLKLHGRKIYLKHPRSVCLPKLAELELNCVEYESNETVPKLIFNSPVLQSLTIKHKIFRDDWICTVASLSLKRLNICFDLERRFDVYRKLRIDGP